MIQLRRHTVFPAGIMDMRVRAPASAAASSLLTGLVAYWTLSDTADASGMSNLINTAPSKITFGVGKIGDAAYGGARNANIDFLYVADSELLSVGPGDWTISAWAYPTQTEYSTVICKCSGVSNGEFAIIQNGGVWQVAIYDGGERRIGSRSVTLNAWSHIIVWHVAATKTYAIIVNAQTAQSATYSGNIPNSTAAVRILGATQTGYDGLNGRADEIGIWNRSLTSAERMSIYNSGNGIAYPFAGT